MSKSTAPGSVLRARGSRRRELVPERVHIPCWDLWTDIAYAWRRLRGSPGFTLFTIATLALGIGATTAIYSVVYAVALRPPDIPEIERVANLYHADPRGGGSAPMLMLARADYDDYRAAQTSFAALAAWKRVLAPLTANGSADMAMGEAIGGEYFAVVGIRPSLGRAIQPADDRADAPRVIVLSDAFWRKRFGSDPAVIGRTMKVGPDVFEIIGVAPPEFRGVDMPTLVSTAFWIPLAAAPISGDELTSRERRSVLVKGRLKPDRTLDGARSELQAIARRLDAVHPIGVGLDPRRRLPFNTSRPWFLLPAIDVRMHESVQGVVGPLVATIMIAVGLVLLVACTNIANLMLARGSARRHEMAVRLALGASRWRLVRGQLVESLLVAVVGGAAAYVVVQVLIVRLLSAELRVAAGIAVEVAPDMNASVVLVGAASTALALVVFGLIPALHGSRTSVREAIASGGQGTPVPTWRGRRGLIACQVAVSAGLVSVAALCAQQIVGLVRHDTGLDMDRLALLQINASMQGRDQAGVRQVAGQIVDAARRLPGVESAALSSGFPIEINTGGGAVARTQSELGSGITTMFVVATPEVFATWGVRVLQGRAFTEHDTASSERVAVLTKRQAERLFPDGAALGERIALRWQVFTGEPRPPVETLRIVGIVTDTDTGSVGNRGGGYLYVPLTQHYPRTVTLSVRAAGDPAPLVDRMRRVVTGIDPELPIVDAGTAAALGRSRRIVLEVAASAAGALGALALVLAMAGLYGVLSELVVRRTREMGIRMALGADSSQVLRMVLADGVRPVLLGLVIGFGCGAVLRVAFRPMFIRMLPAFDPYVIALVPCAFVVAAVVAAYLPARRASRTDPNVALRHL